MIQHIKKDTYCISLDIKGKELTSEEFSKKCGNRKCRYKKSISKSIC